MAKLVNLWHLHLGAAPVKTVLFPDSVKMMVDLRSQTELYSFFSGHYDDKFIGILKRLLMSGGNFLDVGANIGFYSIPIANSISDKQFVFCFEPVPTNFSRLQENINLNNLEHKINAFPFGLSDRNCVNEITLREDFKSGSKTGNAAISISKEADQDFEKIRIQLKRLDDLLQTVDFGAVSVIKIDIEGHEDHFLSGAQKFIELMQPIILCEINKPYYRWRGVDLDEIFKPLIPHNYLILRLIRSKSGSELQSVEEFDVLGQIENVFLCPDVAFEYLNQVASIR